MKPYVLTLFLLIIFNTRAQQDSALKNRRGKIILPERHDMGIGLSANPVFNYLGNFFSNSGNNSFGLNLINGNNFYIKYFLSSKNALRLRTYLNSSSNTTKSMVPNDYDPTGQQMVTDKRISNSNGFSLSLGYERRKGAGRLQFFTGGEFILNQSYTTNKFTYGNAISAKNIAPTTSSFISTAGFLRLSNRTLYANSNNGLGLGLRGFMGLEYFPLPKVSVGGELGLSAVARTKGITSSRTEFWSFATNSYAEIYQTQNSEGTSYATDILGGQIFVIFHFR